MLVADRDDEEREGIVDDLHGQVNTRVATSQCGVADGYRDSAQIGVEHGTDGHLGGGEEVAVVEQAQDDGHHDHHADEEGCDEQDADPYLLVDGLISLGDVVVDA